MINTDKKLYISYTAIMLVLALVGTFAMPESWKIYYTPLALCALMWVVFTLSYMAGKIPSDAQGYQMIMKYLGGAVVRMIGVIAVIFYPVVTAEKGSFSGMTLVLCVMELYAVGMGLYLMKIKNTPQGEKANVNNTPKM
ncbi:MAG: hypothetical protein PHD21_04280 [Flavobacteriales bacterium]|nr:hypothetical protein [Flavobacteriales bacterium]